MKRTQARKILMQLLFSMEAQGDYSAVFFDDFMLDRIRDQRQLAYAKDVYEKWVKRKDEIDGKISKFAKGWSKDRMAKTDLAVLRLAITEILYCQSIPFKSAISEALNLSESFGTEKSRQFVHGILSSVTKEAGYDNPKQ